MVGEWPIVKIGKLAESVSKTHSFGKDQLIFLNTSDIFRGQFLHNNYSNVKEWPGQAKKSIQIGDILYSEIRPANGRYAYVDFEAEDYVVSTKLMVIRPRRDILSRYLYHYLTSKEIMNWLQHMAEYRSGTFPQITFNEIANLEIELPPVSIQKSIVAFIDSLDDKIELNRRMNKTLEDMARAIFNSWFVNFDPVRAKAEGRDTGLPKHIADLFPDSFENSELGEIPRGWSIGNISDIAEISSGKRPPLRHPIFSEYARYPLWGSNGPMAFVSEPLTNHPIIVTGRVGTLGSVFRIVTPCWPSDNTLILTPKNDCKYNYLLFHIKRIDFYSLNRGSTQPLLTQTDLMKQRVVIPTNSEMEYFNRIVKSMFNRADLADGEFQNLCSLREILLPKLISGELRIPDAERIVGRIA